MNIWNSYGFKWVCFPSLTWKRLYCIVNSVYHLPYLFELLFWQHFYVFWCFGKIIIKLLLSNITFRRFSSFMPKTIIYTLYVMCGDYTLLMIFNSFQVFFAFAFSFISFSTSRSISSQMELNKILGNSLFIILYVL